MYTCTPKICLSLNYVNVFIGLAILLPFLLSRNPLWKNCKLRIFVAGTSDIDSARVRSVVIHYLHVHYMYLYPLLPTLHVLLPYTVHGYFHVV